MTTSQRIKELETEISDLRIAFMLLVRDKHMMSDSVTFDKWRRKVRKELSNGKLRDDLRVGRDKTWHAT